MYNKCAKNISFSWVLFKIDLDYNIDLPVHQSSHTAALAIILKMSGNPYVFFILSIACFLIENCGTTNYHSVSKNASIKLYASGMVTGNEQKDSVILRSIRRDFYFNIVVLH